MTPTHVRDATNLTGRILIAMPAMQDPRFTRSVVLVCAHSEEGAMGLILNRAMPDVSFAELLEQLEIAPDAELGPVEVRFGGPVEPARGFVLHLLPEEREEDDEEDGVLRIGPRLAMTTSRDILVDIAQGDGPEAAVLALGYAGWGPGQLEDEMAANGWLTGESGDELIFAPADSPKWDIALKAQGIDPSTLSTMSGRA